MPRKLHFIPYPSVGKHGVTGDRRTAALTASDGTVDWLCLPDYDSPPVFGALLDAEHGGYFRVGPSVPFTGSQRYDDHTPTVVTRWESAEGTLELRDLMANPEDERQQELEGSRVLLRHLRCTSGKQTCRIHASPRENFGPAPELSMGQNSASFACGGGTVTLWASVPLHVGDDDILATFSLEAGDEVWVVLAFDTRQEARQDAWSEERARQAYDRTIDYWEQWLSRIQVTGPRGKRLMHSGLILHLMGYAPSGSIVAAPTTSLPERIGGTLNWDYRYAWIRDGSLSIAGLTLLGAHETASRYLGWLASLTSTSSMPLQVAYHINGDPHLAERVRPELAGYRDSRPVRFGNRAFNQIQTGALGYLADCTLIYLEQGKAPLTDDVWHMTERIANWITAHWQEEDSGIWELPHQANYTSSRVMSWVTLDRAIKIAERADFQGSTKQWRAAREAIFEDVMRHGWSEKRKSFVQRYGADALDASVLLISVMGFLPPDHPRVCGTRDRIAEDLSIDGLIYRFDPLESPVAHPEPMGQYEASFLPCTFWLASSYALAGMVDQAEHVLQRAEQLDTNVSLFSEEADPRNNDLLGNYPLVFSQVEYLRAVLLVDRAHNNTASHHSHTSHTEEPHDRDPHQDEHETSPAGSH